MTIHKSGKTADVNVLLDLLQDQYNLKNDAALSRWLGVRPPVISKLRHGHMPLGPSLLVRIHERTGMSTRQVCVIAGLPPSVED